MEDLKPGDTVTIKSGGPDMTVIKVVNETIECSWFDTQENPRQHAFNKNALKISQA